MSVTRDLVREHLGWKLIVHPLRYQQLLEAIRTDKPITEISNKTLSYCTTEIIQSPYVGTHIWERRKIYYWKRKPKAWEPTHCMKQIPILGYWMNLWGERTTIYR
jgi:hypothetical protein